MGSLVSSTVSTGQDVLASHLTNVRKDVALFGGDYVTATGSANAYAVSLDAQIVAYVTGMTIKFKANFANTGPATVNGNSLGAKSLVKDGNVALGINDILNNQIITAIYDGTNFQITNKNFAYQEVVDLTAGENVDGSTTPQAVYVSDGTGGRTAGRYYKSDANDTSNGATKFIGFAIGNVTTGNTGQVVINGKVSSFSGLTQGLPIYLSPTAGSVTQTKPTGTDQAILVGDALSATELLITNKLKINIQNITVSSSSNTTVTLGWPPRYVEVIAHTGGASHNTSHGYSDGTNNFCIYNIGSNSNHGTSSSLAWNTRDNTATSSGSDGTITFSTTGYVVDPGTYESTTTLICKSYE